MPSFREKVIKLAHDNPKLRSDLLPLLRAGAEKEAIRMPTMDRSFYLPSHLRDTTPEMPEGTDLAIYTWEENGTPYGIAFQGKAKKPLWNYSFRGNSQRDQYIEKTIRSRRTTLEEKKKRQQEKKDFQHGLSVGDILYSSWGYDQTNIDFYEVTKLMGKMVMMRPIAQKTVREERGSDWVVPLPGRFTGAALRKKPQSGYGGGVYVKLNSFSSASLWDGKPKRQTAAGWGH
jgi:hypothetical protein